MKSFILVLLFSLASATNICAQASRGSEGGTEKKEVTSEKASDQAERMRKVLEGLQNNKTDALILPDASSLEILDDPTKEKFFAAMREYYDYRVSGYKHRTEVFEWQLVSSKVIFVVVIFLVLAGVYFSWVQFRSAFPVKRMPDSAQTHETPDSTPPVKPDITEFVASLKGIRISSPILGVIILVISLVFFYLYLVYVYPIHECCESEEASTLVPISLLKGQEGECKIIALILHSG